jgi:hypothetical protein
MSRKQEKSALQGKALTGDDDNDDGDDGQVRRGEAGRRLR